MKFALLLSLTIALVGCGTSSQSPEVLSQSQVALKAPAAQPERPYRPLGPGSGMDSPIIISDGSPEAHFHRQGADKGKGGNDVQIGTVVSGGASRKTVTVGDVDTATGYGYQVTQLESWNVNPSINPIAPAVPWTLMVYDNNQLIMSMMSTDNRVVSTTLDDFDASKDSSSSGHTYTNGTDLKVKDSQGRYPKFTRAVYTDPNYPNGVTFSCSVSGNKHCKICFHYEPPSTTSHTDPGCRTE
jgi:hypothetical protein